MTRHRRAALARILTAAVLGLGGAVPGVVHAGGGHGGGAGHALAVGPGWGGYRGGFYGRPGFYRPGGFYGYRGYYGYPGWYGLGLGMGLGLGLGYAYGYPYAGGYPVYAGGYPVYAGPGYGPPPAPGPVCLVSAQGAGAAPPSAPAPGAPLRLTDSDMILNIHVPPEAIVRINGETTSQKGGHREFVASGLSPGRTYTFLVAARWVDPNGRSVQMEQRVRIQGGERRNVDFLTPSP